MTGEQLFEKYVKAGGEYSRLLMTIMYNIGKGIEPLLDQAEREGKKLSISEQAAAHDELTGKDIIFV